MYQALYRKWRPMVFKDVIGQPQVVDTLKRQVDAGRLSHAYLFTGTRGTGKTTCAKILAKAANCEHPIDGEPCNKCPSCIGINTGRISDVTEIDAASNSGVDNIRSIREQTAFSPVETRYRVYIIDECHMLSAGAFNALLKTLEEPPEHVIFILATTELYKVPATILSRCQRFSFRRITSEDIARHLSEIAASEGMQLTEDASALIARLAEGGFRDAISMLDQAAATTDGILDVNAVLYAFNLSGADESLNILKAISARDSKRALELLSELYYAGKDIPALLGELSSILRDALLLAATGDSSLLTGSVGKNELASLGFSQERLIYLLKSISDTQARLTRSLDKRLDAELCIVTLCDERLDSFSESSILSRISRIEEMISNGSIVKPARAKQNISASDSIEIEDDALPWSVPSDNPPPLPKTSSSHAKETKTDDNAAKAVRNDAVSSKWWEDTLDILKSRLPPACFFKIKTMPLPVVEEGRIILDPTPFTRQIIDANSSMSEIEKAASEILNRPVRAIYLDMAKNAPEQPEKTDKINLLTNKKYKNFKIVD